MAALTVTTWAGTGAATTTDGFRTSATINSPLDLFFQPNGNMIIAEYGGNRIRQVAASTGQMTVLAGSGSPAYGDGQGVAASFNQPYGMCQDSQGNIFVSDNNNHRIRKISPSAYVSTFAGSGSLALVNGQGVAASFSAPTFIATDGSDNLFVGEYNNNDVRKITPTGLVTSFAGYGTGAFGDGQSTTAFFNKVLSIRRDALSQFFLADFANNRIRLISATGFVSTLAGTGIASSIDGPSTVATFNNPVGLVLDTQSNLYVSDLTGNIVRKIVFCSVLRLLCLTGR